MDVGVEAEVNSAELIVGLFALALFGFSILQWIIFLARDRGGWFPLMSPVVSREPQPWGFVDLAFAVATYLFMTIVAASTGVSLGIGKFDKETGTADLNLNAWVSLVSMYAIFLATYFIMTRHRVPASRIGWDTSSWSSDLLLAVRAFVFYAPPLLIVMAAATHYSDVPYEHPVIEETKKDSSKLVSAIIMAVLCAPITEEFGFRGLLQGFLESLSLGRLSLRKFFRGQNLGEAKSEAVSITPSEVHETSPDQNPFALPIQDPPLTQTYSSTNRIPVWPIFVAGTLFGLAHFSYGVSWIPLCLFGFVLGGLYRATNRIWPCIFLHALFNGFAMSMLAFQLLFGSEFKS